jgi:hypothetical protein
VLIVVDKYPQYKGYLYAHDDMIFNISKLMTFDLSYIWRTHSPVKRNLIDSWDFRNHTWSWLNLNVGIDAMQNAIAKYDIIRKGLRQFTGNEKVWFSGQSDFIYVPQKQISNYINIMSTFRNEKVFLEIAYPTFAECFVPEFAIEELKLCTFWDSRRGNIVDMSRECPKNTSAYHPVKLSGGQQAVIFMKKKSGLMNYEN